MYTDDGEYVKGSILFNASSVKNPYVASVYYTPKTARRSFPTKEEALRYLIELRDKNAMLEGVKDGRHRTIWNTDLGTLCTLFNNSIRKGINANKRKSR